MIGPRRRGGETSVSVRETEQMKMRCRAQLYANFMTLL